jgi:hypothetical protein
MTPAPKRRWFRWSLRRMFALVTIFACWLGWNANWIQQRRLLAAKHRVLAAEMKERGIIMQGRPLIRGRHAAGWHTTSVLWLFRERPRLILMLVFVTDGVSMLTVDKLSDSQKAELARAENLFPEAAIDWATPKHHNDPRP